MPLSPGTMADEDIYKNKRRYERTIQSLDDLASPPPCPTRRGQRRHYCRNRENLHCFKQLHRLFESRDTSYIRRNKVFHILLFITSCTDKELGTCDRDDVDLVIASGQRAYRTPESKKDFLKITRWIWKKLFPEDDALGRPDERIVPYVVRHIPTTVDRSRSRMRNDRLTLEEFGRLVAFFSNDAQMQAYVTIATESLGRPQEMCFRRIRDLELHENYGRIWVSSHGKEGTKFLQCIDSYPYLLKWIERHPYQSDPDAFLFMAKEERDRALTPAMINRRLKTACKRLGIDKRITAYSLKRNGVTFRRLRGDSDVEIQHVAGWTSTKQLQTYDLSNAEDTFRGQLTRRGLVPSEPGAGIDAGMETTQCACGARVGFAERLCPRCKRQMDPEQTARELKANQEIRDVFAIALTQPGRSFAEIIEEYRRRRVTGCNREPLRAT